MAFLDKLKAGLSKTKNAIFGQIDEVLKAFVKVDEDLLEELEEILITSDIGMDTTMKIMEKLRKYIKENKLGQPEDIKEALANLLGLEPTDISIKAKTKEKLDAVGENKAIEANAVVLLERID